MARNWTLEDVATDIWDHLERNPGGFEIGDLTRVVSRSIGVDLGRSVIHRAFEVLRDEVQSDQGRAFITYRSLGRTVYALATEFYQVLAYQLTRERVNLTRARRDERNALAAIQQWPDRRDARQLVRSKTRVREDIEDRIEE